jgi:class 3 adenylate cyclase
VTRETQLAVLFADISGSTRLYEMLGDATAHALVGKYIALLIEEIQRQSGTLIKTIGDEVMATFPTAEAAAVAACEMQERVSVEATRDATAIAVRIGFISGRALLDDGDVYGDIVNLAARLTAQAKVGQILTEGETVSRLKALTQQACRQIDLTQVRGKNVEIAVFELMWRTQDATMMFSAGPKRRPTSGQLVVVGAGQSLTVGDHNPSLTIGREEQNDLIVRRPLVSRLHARIEFRHGRFILADVSTNGTYVVMDGRDSIFTHRDTQELVGSGVLGLGEAVSAQSPAVVRFGPG